MSGNLRVISMEMNVKGLGSIGAIDMMIDAAKNLSKTMPNAEWKTLKGQTHQPSPEIIAPVLAEFLGQQTR